MLSLLSAALPRTPTSQAAVGGARGSGKNLGHEIRRHLAPELKCSGAGAFQRSLDRGVGEWLGCPTAEWLLDPSLGLPCVVRDRRGLSSSLLTSEVLEPKGAPLQSWGSQCEEGALWRDMKEKLGFTGGRRPACAKAQRCGKAEFGV